MANNIRAVSPTLFFLPPFLPPLSLFLSRACSLPFFCPSPSRLPSLFSRLFSPVGFGVLPRASGAGPHGPGFRSWFTAAVLDAVATHPGTRHIRRSSPPPTRPCAHEVVCAARKSRFCARKMGYVRRWRLLSDDAGKKGVIRGLLNALLVRYK